MDNLVIIMVVYHLINVNFANYEIFRADVGNLMVIQTCLCIHVDHSLSHPFDVGITCVNA